MNLLEIKIIMNYYFEISVYMPFLCVYKTISYSSRARTPSGLFHACAEVTIFDYW